MEVFLTCQGLLLCYTTKNCEIIDAKLTIYFVYVLQYLVLLMYCADCALDFVKGLCNIPCPLRFTLTGQFEHCLLLLHFDLIVQVDKRINDDEFNFLLM